MKITSAHVTNRFSIYSEFFIAREKAYKNCTLLIYKDYYGSVSELSLKELYINFIKDLYNMRYDEK